VHRIVTFFILLNFAAGSLSRGTDFDSEIRPILERVCVDCHGPEKQKADLRIDQLNPDFLRGGDVDTWHDSLDQIHLGEMPPEKAEKQLTKEERQILTSWINEGLKEVVAATRHLGGRVSSRRLTRYEYANTMRDLLGIDYDFARELPPEPASPEGFLNNGRTLELSPTQIETYLAVARKALSLAIVEGEKPKVHIVQQDKTAVGRLPRKKDGGAIPINPEFVLDVDQFPRTGEFEIRIEAGAVIPEGNDFPCMEVWLGCVPGIIHVPRKLVGKVDVRAPADKPETFVFRGRMEDFPQAGETRFGGGVDFNGVIVMLDFFDADGKELRYPHRRYSDPPPKPKKKGAPVPKLPPAPDGPLLDIVVHSVRYEAPVLTSWPPPSHLALLDPAGSGADEREAAKAALESFLPRAFRRPVKPAEVEPFVSLFREIRPGCQSFPEAIRETFAAVLVSPHFLHLVDTRDDFAIANRLSYLLWSTAPDEELRKLAESGRLREPETLARETARLMNDSRASEFVNRFTDQWFDLGGLDRVAVNPEFFPDFDNGLKEAMRQETREVFGEILRGDLSCLELIDSNWTMANHALATHYGLRNRPRSGAFERVALTAEDRRGGLLGQGAFLLSNSNGEASHPIKRAVWILDRLLDSPPAPPPPDVPELDPENPDLAGLSVKQQLAVHREKESCRSCHEGIDPWGIALENFDAVGLSRSHAAMRIRKNGTVPRGPALDPATTLPDGTKINGIEDLKQFLLRERRTHFARAVTKRLATYALGRSLELADREAIESLTADFERDGFRLRGLIVDLVTSELFTDS
jgi:hypothetical protein